MLDRINRVDDSILYHSSDFIKKSAFKYKSRFLMCELRVISVINKTGLDNLDQG